MRLCLRALCTAYLSDSQRVCHKSSRSVLQKVCCMGLRLGQPHVVGSGPGSSSHMEGLDLPVSGSGPSILAVHGGIGPYLGQPCVHQGEQHVSPILIQKKNVPRLSKFGKHILFLSMILFSVFRGAVEGHNASFCGYFLVFFQKINMCWLSPSRLPWDR